MADHARVTQVVEEVLGAGAGPARVTQVVEEVLGAGAGAARVTQVVIEVISPAFIPADPSTQPVWIGLPPKNPRLDDSRRYKRISPQEQAANAFISPPEFETLPPPPPVDPSTEPVWIMIPPQNPRHDPRRYRKQYPSHFFLSIGDPTEARITQATIEVLEEEQAPTLEARITQATTEILEEVDTQTIRVSQYWVEVLIPLFDCPTFPPNPCPGIIVGTRDDGLPYDEFGPAPCPGPGTKGAPRDDGLAYTEFGPAPCGGSGTKGGSRTGQ